MLGTSRTWSVCSLLNPPRATLASSSDRPRASCIAWNESVTAGREASDPGGAHTLGSEEPHSAPAPLPPTPGTACLASRAALLGLQHCYSTQKRTHFIVFHKNSNAHCKKLQQHPHLLLKGQFLHTREWDTGSLSNVPVQRSGSQACRGGV